MYCATYYRTVGLLALVVSGVQAAFGMDAAQIYRETGIRGGLVVQIGCGDGNLTAALRAHDGLIVHGIDTRSANVTAARARIEAAGLYGPVSVDRFDGTHLPYRDNLVNLIVAEDLGAVPISEVMRILCRPAMPLHDDARRPNPLPGRPADRGRVTASHRPAGTGALGSTRRSQLPRTS